MLNDDSVPSVIDARSVIDRLLDGALDPLFAEAPRAGVPSDWYGHVPFAFWLVAALRPATIVEIGTRHGVAYAALCGAVCRSGLDTKAYAIDDWDDDVFADLAAFHDARYASFSRLIRTDADTAWRQFPDGSVDLLHLAGPHGYDAVRQTFEAWRPKLSRRAVVLLHRSNVHESGYGVWRFWAALRDEFPGFEFLHGQGLGVLAVGPALTGPARALCELASAGPIAALRHRFAQSGLRCQAESDQSRIEAELRDVHDRLPAAESLRDEAARLDLIAVAGETRFAVTRDTLAQTADALAVTRAQLAAAEAQVEQDGHEIAFRDLQIGERDRLIVHYRGYETAYNVLTQSTMWRTLGVIRSGIDKMPAPARHALRQGAKAALWAATPWRIAARLQRRRDYFAALAAPPTPVEIVAPPEPPPAPPPPPPPVDPFSIDGIDRPRTGYLPLIAAFDPIAPEVSIVILNWNGGERTRLCLQHVWQHTTGHHYEIIVVDNGSTPDEVERLRAEAPLLRIVPLGGNRYTGEASNIGVEAARGRLVCLLDNAAFVSPGWLEPLVAALRDTPGIGAVGPGLLDPDGGVRDAGGLVDADGSIVHLGRGATAADPALVAPRVVDFVSAACLLVRRADFIRALGFDLAWEPGQYEAVDFCLKLRLLGLRALYCPRSAVTHIAGVPTSDEDTSPAPDTVAAMNRGKFVDRWGRYLDTAGADRPALIPAGPVTLEPAAPADPARRVLIYSPYRLTPGGGERYILTIAEAFRDNAHVALVTPWRVSRMRLLTMAREFGLDLDQLELLCPDDLAGRPLADVAFVLGNEIFPTVGGMATHNIYICQFPFPFEREDDLPRRMSYWREFERVVTYSEYVSTHVRREIARRKVPARPIEVLAPPVPMIGVRAEKRRGQILHVGRFFVGGHGKRQDALIDAFRMLREAGVDAELHFAGSVMPEPEHRAYYAGLLDQAQGLPIRFHANCSVGALHRLYAESDLYWHATGVGRDTAAAPHLVEHFGISIVEAMSARCIPLVFAAGGPVSIVQDGVTGFHFQTLAELAARTRTLLQDTDAATLDTMRAAAAAAASAYDEDIFRTHVRAIVARCEKQEPEGASASL